MNPFLALVLKLVFLSVAVTFFHTHPLKAGGAILAYAAFEYVMEAKREKKP